MQGIYLNLEMKCQWKNTHNIIDQAFQIRSFERLKIRYSKCQYLITDCFRLFESAVQPAVKKDTVCLL